MNMYTKHEDDTLRDHSFNLVILTRKQIYNQTGKKLTSVTCVSAVRDGHLMVVKKH